MKMFWTSTSSLLFIAVSLLSFNVVAFSIASNPSIVTSLNASSYPYFSTNITNLGAIDASKFSVAIQAGDVRLAPTATLMNAVDTMVQLALMDFEGQMSQTTFKLDIAKYSQVEILIGPISTAPDATMPPGFAILGLHRIMLYVLTDPMQRFKSLHSYLSYQDRRVGTLEIRKSSSSSSGSLSDKTDETTSGVLSIFNATNPDSTALTAPAWQDPHLDVSINQGLNTFTIYEIFFFVLSTIREFLLNKRTARVMDFTTIINTPPITTAGQPILISFKNSGTPPRTARNPPYFQFEWLFKAFGQLPQRMIDLGNFQEVLGMFLQVDGVRVGEGYIVRKPPGLESSTDTVGAGAQYLPE